MLFILSMTIEAALVVWTFSNLSKKVQVALAVTLLGVNSVTVCCMQNLPQRCIPVLVASILLAMAGIIFGVMDLRNGAVTEKFTISKGLYLISVCMIAAGAAYVCIYPVDSIGVCFVLIGFGVIVTIGLIKRVFLSSGVKRYEMDN